MDIERCKLQIWELEIEIWCEEAVSTEREAKGDRIGHLFAAQLVEVYIAELDERKQECRAYEKELEDNNAERVKLYHYFIRRGDIVNDATAMDNETMDDDIPNDAGGMAEDLPNAIVDNIPNDAGAFINDIPHNDGAILDDTE
ncbi:hypothetical protein V5O48_016791 [Marasmius crinis-equi]|uniref:Uncharacterized protein n=1 Tax=Marasmius crinis-equi TaxID=585013 RepID=A0ABR3EQS2_9AGAR